MNSISVIRLLAIFVLTLSFAALPGTSPVFNIPRAHADFAPTRITDSRTQWVPAGPALDKMQIQVYTDEVAEYTALASSPPQLDLTDWPVPPAQISQFVGDSRFFVTAQNSEFGMFDIDFNAAANFFGIAGCFNLDGVTSASLASCTLANGTTPPGAAAPLCAGAPGGDCTTASENFRQGVAHLISKTDFISKVLLNHANPLDNAVPPGQSLSTHTGQPSNAQNPPNPSTQPTPSFTFSPTTEKHSSDKDPGATSANDLQIAISQTTTSTCQLQFTSNGSTTGIAVITCPSSSTGVDVFWDSQTSVINACQWIGSTTTCTVPTAPGGSPINDFSLITASGAVITSAQWTVGTISSFKTLGTSPLNAPSGTNRLDFSFTAATATGAYNIPYRSSGATGTYALGGACSWDKSNGVTVGSFTHASTCVSAFKESSSDATDSAGIVTAIPAPGTPNPDFCDAAIHMVQAGLANGINSDCTLGGPTPGGHWTGTGTIVFMVRSDSPPRRTLGLALAARLCELINGVGVTSCSQITIHQLTILQALSIVFPTGTTLTSWNMYTAGWSLGSQFDQLFALYNSAFSSVGCGQPKTKFGQDYVYNCNTAYDHFTNILEFNDTISGATASAQVAMQIFGTHVVTIPIWSGANQFGYQKGWQGINDGQGVGIPNFFTWLNAWAAAPPTGGISGTFRLGFKQGTVNLNPYLFTTVWEAFVVGQLYDTLIASNPYDSGTLFGWQANTFTRTGPHAGDPAGTVSDIAVNLKSNLFFHDGIKVTANDVRFSFNSFATSGGSEASLVAGIVDVTIVNDFNFRINLKSNSVFALFNVGGVLVVPQHIWSVCGTTPTPAGCAGPASNNSITKCGATDAKSTPQCALRSDFASIDPVISHQLIGSSAFECVDLSTAAVGGGCTSSGSQAVDAGGTIILQRTGLGFAGTDLTHSYFRDSAKYKLWQWADINNVGTVDASDLVAATSCSGAAATAASCGHWAYQAASVITTNCGIAGTCNGNSETPPGGTVPTGGSCTSANTCANAIPAGTTVSSTEVNQALGQFGSSWTASSTPITYSTLTGAQSAPQSLYEGGLTYGP